MTDPVAAREEPLPCIVCGFQPEAVGGTGYQPVSALMFSAGSGHYGSGVWDTMSGWRSLEINVCDNCLLERKDRVAVAVTPPFTRPDPEFVRWDPDAG